MGASAQLSPQPLMPEQLLADFIAGLDGAGAIVSFVGLTRPTGRDGAAVNGLFLDHYPGMSDASLRTIASDAAVRFAVELCIVHRCGSVAAGEPIVFAAAAAAHRRIAFDAVDYVMDRLKTDAVLWKREDRADGSTWIEPSEQDGRDRERWR